VAGTERLGARHRPVDVVSVVPAVAVRVSRYRQPLRQRAGQLPDQPIDPLGPLLAVSALGAGTPARQPPVPDPVKDRERLINPITLPRQELTQLTPLPSRQSRRRETREPSRQERPREKPDREIVRQLIDTLREIRRRYAARPSVQRDEPPAIAVTIIESHDSSPVSLAFRRPGG
jgi:hypothetical protein